MMKNLTLFAIGVLICVFTQAQDPEFTQYQNARLYTNPANAGWTLGHDIENNYRNQWPGISGSFVTNQLAYSGRIKNAGIGVMWTIDRAGRGTINTNELDLIYAHHHGTGDLKFSWGVKAGFFKKRLDYSKLTFGNQIDPRYGFIYESNEVPSDGIAYGFDAGIGAKFHYMDFSAGWAIDHLAEPNESMINGNSKLPRKHTVTIGRDMDMELSALKVLPGIMIAQQQNFTQIQLDLLVQYKGLVTGAAYRNQDAFVLKMNYVHKRFAVGYAYDVTFSKLSNATIGSHEGYLAVRLGKNASSD